VEIKEVIAVDIHPDAGSNPRRHQKKMHFD
jgi:hypothetical protein